MQLRGPDHVGHMVPVLRAVLEVDDDIIESSKTHDFNNVRAWQKHE
jgi:hypothetical protein